ncbi:related to 7alpha-cephem-methoxylase P8 chain [Phialocephala subalpina]|uniref:Related to 7alpha-cephem-methoxylase P8 chain n=1 Tax=Phialocephala subalpina TaxID=576137 RepID=A0A1L7X3H6_9HELO|nr:related to 7alpha-cephem-methoxylase P8 chain [Phialocephala subalpina]
MASAATQQAFVSEPFGAQGDHYNYLTTQLGSSYQDIEIKPRDIITTLNYFKDNEDGSPPAPSYVGKIDTYNRPVVPTKTVVHDIRGTESQYTLDTKGFQIVNHVSIEKDFQDEEQIKRIYYPETEELLKRATGASKVFIFDHTIRRQTIDSRIPPNDPNKPITLRGPVQRVHIDQSYAAGPKRVEHHLPAEAPTLLRGRYQIINVWRPIKTILKDPLGVAEAGSVNDGDLVPIKLIYPDREGETYSVRGSPEHKWHYLYKQTPEEVLLIKCFDSKTDGRARRVPHTAFVDEGHEDEATRESIEVRALVFHPDDIE